MKWRCGAHGGAERCMLAPGHTGAHQSVLMADGQVGLVTWLSPEITWLPSGAGDLGVGHGETESSQVEPPAPEPVVYAEATITIEPRKYEERSDLAGRKRTRAHINEPYAALDEGIHTNWNLFGHEVGPLPTLEETERKMR